MFNLGVQRRTRHEDTFAEAKLTALTRFLKAKLPYIPHDHTPYLDHPQTTNLHTAADNGDVKAITNLIEQKQFAVDQLISGGNTALICAADRNRLPALKQLMKLGAKINATNILNQTALHFSVARNHINIIIELVRAGADIDNKLLHTLNSRIVLILATGALLKLIKQKNLQDFARLLKQHRSIDCYFTNNENESIISLAEKYAKQEENKDDRYLKLLKVTRLIKNQNTLQDCKAALLASARQGHNDAVKHFKDQTLKEHKANLTEEEMALIATHCELEQVFPRCNVISNPSNALVQQPDEKDSKIANSTKPAFSKDFYDKLLIDSATRGHLDNTRYLIEQWAVDIHAQDAQQHTALSRAVQNNHVAVVEWLCRQNSAPLILLADQIPTLLNLVFAGAHNEEQAMQMLQALWGENALYVLITFIKNNPTKIDGPVKAAIIHIVIQCSDSEILAIQRLKVLLNAGATYNKASVQLAIQKGYLGVLALFIKHDPTKIDGAAKTIIIELAILSDDETESLPMVEALLNANAFYNEVSVQLAFQKNYSRILIAFLKRDPARFSIATKISIMLLVIENSDNETQAMGLLQPLFNIFDENTIKLIVKEKYFQILAIFIKTNPTKANEILKITLLETETRSSMIEITKLALQNGSRFDKEIAKLTFEKEYPTVFMQFLEHNGNKDIEDEVLVQIIALGDKDLLEKLQTNATKISPTILEKGFLQFINSMKQIWLANTEFRVANFKYKLTVLNETFTFYVEMGLIVNDFIINELMTAYDLTTKNYLVAKELMVLILKLTARAIQHKKLEMTDVKTFNYILFFIFEFEVKFANYLVINLLQKFSIEQISYPAIKIKVETILLEEKNNVGAKTANDAKAAAMAQPAIHPHPANAAAALIPSPPNAAVLAAPSAFATTAPMQKAKTILATEKECKPTLG